MILVKILNLIKVILIGIIEGVTEWLPISSTGHMIIVEKIINMKDIFINKDAFYDLFLVVIQLGAVSAVIIRYFRKILPSKNSDNRVIFKNWLYIIISTIPVVIVGLVFDNILFSKLYNVIIVAVMLIVYGIIFLFIENKKFKKQELNIKTAFLIGLFQILALVPGTSRSGILIIAGIVVLGDKVAATEFSFLCSIPVIFGASFLKIIKYLSVYKFANSDLMLLIIGMLVSFGVSILVLNKLVNIVSKKSLKYFGVYRIILGIVIFIILLV